MAKKIFSSWFPDPEKIRSHPSVRIFGSLLQDPNLWHLNRRSVRLGFLIGLSFAFVPLPSQMILAALAAIALRGNLPISVTLVWITNPVTMPAIFYICYKVGAVLLGTPVQAFVFTLSWDWVAAELSRIWRPFLLGCLVCGTFAGLLGAAVVDTMWRNYTLNRWRLRVKARKSRISGNAAPPQD